MSASLQGREVTVTGFDELFKVMDDLADEVGQRKVDRIWTGAMRKAMQPVLDAARAQVPRHFGYLMDALYLRAHKPRSRDKQSQSYQGEAIMARVSIANERPDSVRSFTVDKKGKLRSYINFRGSNKPVALAMEFGTATTPAHPFLRMALEGQAATVQTILGNEVWKVLETKYSKVRQV